MRRCSHRRPSAKKIPYYARNIFVAQPTTYLQMGRLQKAGEVLRTAIDTDPGEADDDTELNRASAGAG